MAGSNPNSVTFQVVRMTGNYSAEIVDEFHNQDEAEAFIADQSNDTHYVILRVKPYVISSEAISNKSKK